MRDREERARLVREYREKHAEATDGRQRRISIVLAVVVGLMGVLMVLGGILTPSGWGIAGGACVMVAVVPFAKAEGTRTQSMAPEDRPAVLRELRWFVLGIVLVAVGFVLTLHPWGA